ncbi:sigma-70 family RNA polymerase sigma factor [Peptoniphilus sp. KCTC 25270]|uniref:sigma-70 family RNA polymerase sigma factor n=1 Tax=Peptoniphilus sp. KCTC 25270 TaxID=2897414 RepID=UPI001E5E97A7|nr:sigma-70 family RNA polymerase sigma factor [Peptoniphilus sp. KCTC 25270]MCD1148041.1 sigma-70 family RNA polymerase sigma factor [Peptoniphilus sp. KCTC 25270]
MFGKINQLAEEACHGDESAIVDLTLELEPLMKSLIGKILPYSREREDLLAQGKLILLECLDSFDGSLNVPFLHYFKLQFRYFLLDRVKLVSREDLPILDQPLESGESVCDLIPSLECIEERLLREEEFSELRGFVEALPDREREVLSLYYFHNLGLSEISGFLGISYQTVANTKSNGIRNLRRMYDFR